MTDRQSSRARSTRPNWVGMDPDEDATRPPPLTRARIVRAALRLVDKQGLAALTMRALATGLEVSPMALYNHVNDKEELFDLMLDLMLGEVNCANTEGDWLTQLRNLVCSFNEVLSAHHHLAQVYSQQVKIGPHGLAIIERAIGLLLQAGFSRPDAASAFLNLYTFTVGRHQMGSIAPFSGRPPQDESEYYIALPPEEIPSIRTVGRHLGGMHRPGVFEFGLETLLAGLQKKLELAGDHHPEVVTAADPLNRPIP